MSDSNIQGSFRAYNKAHFDVYALMLWREASRSLNYKRVPEHEMIEQAIEAIWRIPLGRAYDGRYAVPCGSRRWWKSVLEIMWLEVKRTWVEFAQPDCHRMIPRNPPRTLVTIDV